MICIMKFNFVDYNHITALALNNMCKNEQVNQIEKNLKELMFLKEELDSFDEKLDKIANEDLFKDIINPDSQLKLEKIYNKLGNFINYEKHLNKTFKSFPNGNKHK